MREIKFRAKRIDDGRWVYGQYFRTPLTDENSGTKPEDGWYFLSDGKTRHCISSEYGVVFTIDVNTLGQYSGLKINDHEVYEDDIIQYKHYYVAKRWWKTTSEIPEIEREVQKQRDDFHVWQNVVKFDNGEFKLDYPISARDLSRGERFEKGSRHTNDYEEMYWDFKVIGNIHDNPDLLKK